MSAPLAAIPAAPGVPSLRLPRWFAPLAFGALFFAVLFILFFGHDDTTPVVLLMTLLALAIFVPQVILGMKHRWEAFDPLTAFLFICTFGYLFRSMHLTWHEAATLYHIPLWRGDALALLGKGLLMVFMAVMAFYVGYAARIGPAIAARLPVLSPRWSPKRLRLIFLVYTAIGAAVYLVFVQSSGGLLHVATNMQLRTEASSGMHLYYFGIRFLPTALLFRYVLMLRSRPSRFEKISFTVHCLLVFLALGILGSRSWAMEVLFLIMVTRHYLHRPIKLRSLGLIAVSGLLLFAIFYQYRNFTHEGIERSEIQALKRSGFQTFYNGILGHRNFDMLDNLLSVVHYTPDRLPYLQGSSYLHLFVNAIPRKLWEGKPRGIGSVLAEKIYGWGGGGAPPGAIGELYFNFGVMGIVPGMCLLGLFARTFSSYARQNRKNPLAILLLGVATIYVAMVTRGTFFKVGSTFFMRLVPLLIGAGFAAGWQIVRRRSA